MFEYPIDACDVSDRSRLEEYRRKLESWNELLNGDEAHSITGQFSDMMWQDAAWRSTNEARKFTDEDGANASIAPLLGAMLDRGYVAGQVLAISRLLEYSDPKHPKKGVVSLRRLLDEVKDSRELLTRENFVAHDALPYEFEPIEAAFHERLAEQAAATDGVIVTTNETSGPAAFGRSKAQHQLFDQLADKSADNRNRTDLISQSFFERMDAVLQENLFEHIVALRNKSVAHAADAFSRSQATVLRTGVTMDEISRAHYLLFIVYQVLSVVLLGTWRAGAVPVPHHDQFEHLSEPFVRQGRLTELRKFWEDHCNERDAWMTKAYHEILP